MHSPLPHFRRLYLSLEEAESRSGGTQAAYVASSESAVGGGQPVFDVRNIRDHYEQRPVDIAEALNCPALTAMLDPQLPLHLAVAGQGCQASANRKLRSPILQVRD